MTAERNNTPEICFGTNPTDIPHNPITITSADPDALELKVFFHSFYAFNGNSTLIYGKRDAILVSTAGILETGRNLTHVIIPEFHPDHHFCSQIVQDAFPEARIVALQSVTRDVVYSADDKVQLWGKLFGTNVPDRLLFPMPLVSGHLEIEGHAIELSDGWQADQANETMVWIPSLRAAIASDTVFYQAHPWMIESDAPRRQLWKDDLRKLRAMEPLIVVPGHCAPEKFTPTLIRLSTSCSTILMISTMPWQRRRWAMTWLTTWRAGIQACMPCFFVFTGRLALLFRIAVRIKSPRSRGYSTRLSKMKMVRRCINRYDQFENRGIVLWEVNRKYC